VSAPRRRYYPMRAVASQFKLGVIFFLLSSAANAQMSQAALRSRRISQTTEFVQSANETDCAHVIAAKFTGTLSTQDKTYLNACVTDLQHNIPDPGGTPATKDMAITELKATYGLTSSDEVDEQLITTHYLLRVLRRWANIDPGAEADPLTVLDTLDSRIRTMMTYVGLSDPFAGSLVAGPVFGDTGKLSSATVATGAGSTTNTTGTAAVSSGTSTNALAHIEWGSKYFLDESWSSPVDFNFGGSLGLQPALSLLTSPASSTTVPASATTSQYQSAFVWDLNGKTNLHTGTTGELSAFFRAGQVRLLTANGATIVNQGTTSTLEIPLNGNANRTSWFYEAGFEWNFYNKALEIVHAEKGQLDPAFNVGASYKIDTRFTQDAGLVGFTSPDKRLNFRFLINGLKVFDRRPETTASKPYAISFGVEYERGFGSNPVPSGTMLIIRGDVNLIKLINPGAGT
jgi:hypothetical protein